MPWGNVVILDFHDYKLEKKGGMEGERESERETSGQRGKERQKHILCSKWKLSPWNHKDFSVDISKTETQNCGDIQSDHILTRPR